MSDVSINCRCGAVKGVLHDISPSKGSHCVCYCKDCQAFAHFLHRADTMLNDQGGTEIFQTLPSRVSFAEGADNLACVQVTEGGIYRWYADCCNTAIGNTANSDKLPFVGLISNVLGADLAPADRLAALGPVRFAVHTKAAHGPVDKTGQKGAAFAIARAIGRMLHARWTGNMQHNPFFPDGAPAAHPVPLTSDERKAIDSKIAAAGR